MLDAKSSAMTKPKRHHYLPQFYLDGFCRNGQLWVFDRQLNAFRQQTPKNTALESHYYSVEDGGGNKRTDIESFLSQIEGRAKQVIVSLLAGKTIAAEEKEELSIFIAFMMNRVPDFEKSVNMVEKHMIGSVMDLAFSDEARIQSIMDKREQETGEKETISVKELLKFYKSGQYDLVIHRNESLRLMLSLSLEMAKYFTQMEWVIFHTPSRTSFVTTDNPVALVAPPDYDRHSFWGVGIITPGAMKVFPLSQAACLTMYDHGEILSHREIDSQTVRRINLTVTSHSDRFVVGRDKLLVQNLVKTTGIEHYQRNGRFSVGYDRTDT